MDKIFDDSKLIVRRFACDCKWPGHSLDVTVELADEGKRIVQCSLNLYMTGKASVRWRLNQAFECLKGHDGQLADFILRTEDIPDLIATLRSALTTTGMLYD